MRWTKYELCKGGMGNALCKCWKKNVNDTDHLLDLEVDGRIILQFISVWRCGLDPSALT